MKKPSNYAAILIACGTLASVTFPASGSSEEDRINALAEQAILLNNASDDLSSRLEVIEILAGELGTFQSKYQPEAALRVTSKLSEELGEISDELNDLMDAWNEVSNEASVVLPILREIFESDSADPRVEQGSEAFKRLQAVSLAIDFGLRREITEIGNELRITTRSIEMRERLNQGSETEAPAAEEAYLPIIEADPRYPRTPHPLGLAGHCDLEFTITPLGTTANVRVIECTNALFKKASVQAVLKFKYRPRMVNGTAIAVPGIRHRVTFEMDERGRQAIESGLLDQYRALIRQRIESNWVKPADSREDLVWVVLLDILPGNEVNAITFEQFNGTEADRRSIETAIRRSSPLPAPPMPELFEPRLRLRYPASFTGIGKSPLNGT